MTQPDPGLAARARRIHAVLLGGSALISAILVGLTAIQGPALGAPPLFAYAPFLVAIPAVGAAFLLQHPRGTGSEQWWAANFGKALVSWALLETTALVGAVFHFLTGSYLPLVITGASLLLLVLSRPDGFPRT
jgi:hypothetical protein